MRLVFAGTPAFAAGALQALLDAGHEVALVLTQPDRPAGRGLALRASEVKQLALAHALPLSQPLTLRDDNVSRQLADTGAALMVVAAYGLILPQSILDQFPHGCLNIHASLLPRWRGAAPIQRAILAGDAQTGISIMQMDAGLDTGPVLLRQSIPIGARETSGSLHDRLAAVGAQCIVSALARIEAGAAHREPQPDDGVTYAAKISKEEAELDWTRPAIELDRQIRAFNPAPGAATVLDGQPLRIWAAHPVPGIGLAPGSVQDAAAGTLTIACGDGALALDEVQRAGGKRLSVADFQRGANLRMGQRLGRSR
ncbi:MAG: methionyl-tRNA formyltransferase [Burkholderiales bacterium]|nr:methionyl-tRNA formyltransferase [Burkholderiales bacterium]